MWNIPVNTEWRGFLVLLCVNWAFAGSWTRSRTLFALKFVLLIGPDIWFSEADVGVFLLFMLGRENISWLSPVLFFIFGQKPSRIFESLIQRSVFRDACDLLCVPEVGLRS